MADASPWASLVGLVSGPARGLFEAYVAPAAAAFVDHYFGPISNLMYCAAMLYAFVHLPVNAALLLGLSTFLFGPLAMRCVLYALELAVALAVASPILCVFLLWLGLLMQTQLARRVVPPLAQQLALCLGLDRDRSGAVDWLDVVYWCEHRACGVWLTKHVAVPLFGGSVHSHFAERRKLPPPPTVASLERQLERMEAAQGELAHELREMRARA